MSTSPKRSLKRTCAGVSAGALALTGFAAGFAAAATSASATQSFTFSRLAGSDRFGTAAAIATNTFPGGAATVLIANGDTGHFPDALSGNYLAGQDGAPILLTHVDTLPTATSDALTALKAKNVVILGQTSAVGSTVEADLKAKGYSVTRVGGVDRYATARDISESKGATAVGSVGSSGPTALLASGQNFPDALVAGPLGYAGKFPVEITDPNTLSSATQTALQDLKIKNVIIAGGDTAVSQGVENQVKGLNGGITITRLSGVSRTETATTIADYAVKNLGFSNKHVNLARSDDFPDALTGGPHAGAEKSPIILANDPNTLGTAAANWLKANSGTLTDGHIFGGTSAVSNAVQSEATKDAQGTSGATVSSSNSTIAPGGTATISVKGAQPNTALTFSVPANCGTVSPTNPTTDASGNTSSVFTASSTASGSCTITVKDAAGNTVGTSTVTVTPASSNQTINVTPKTQQNVAEGKSVQYTATGLDSTKSYDIQLFDCKDVTVDQNGNATFNSTNPSAGSNPSTAKSTSGTSAPNDTITVANGAPASGGSANGISPQNGSLTFTVTNNDPSTNGTSAPSCVVPVVFQQNPAGTNQDNLILDSAGKPASGQNFGVGGAANFVPAAATSATYNNVYVVSVDKAAHTFVGSPSLSRTAPGTAYYTFDYAANSANTYYDGDVANRPTSSPGYLTLSQAQFNDFLSAPIPAASTPNSVPANGVPGDVVTVYYNTGGPSEFDLNTDVPAAPTNLTANYTTSDYNSTPAQGNTPAVNEAGVNLKWTAPSNLSVAKYYVYRAVVTNTAATSTTPASSTTGTYSKIATVQSSPTGGVPPTQYADPTAAADTTYSYVVTAVEKNYFEEGPSSNAATATTPRVTQPAMSFVTIKPGQQGTLNPATGQVVGGAAGTADVTYNTAVTCATGAGPDFTYSNGSTQTNPTSTAVKGASCAPEPNSYTNTHGGNSGNTLLITFPQSTQANSTSPYTQTAVQAPQSGDTFTYQAPATPSTTNAVYATGSNTSQTGTVFAKSPDTLTANNNAAGGPGNSTTNPATNNPVGTGSKNTNTQPTMQTVTINKSTTASPTNNAGAGTATVVYDQQVTCATQAGQDFTYSNTGGTPNSTNGGPGVKGVDCAPAPASGNYSGAFGGTDTLTVTFPSNATIGFPAQGDTFNYTEPTAASRTPNNAVQNPTTGDYAVSPQTLTGTAAAGDSTAPADPTLNPVATGGSNTGTPITPAPHAQSAVFNGHTGASTATAAITYQEAPVCPTDPTTLQQQFSYTNGGTTATPSASATCSVTGNVLTITGWTKALAAPNGTTDTLTHSAPATPSQANDVYSQLTNSPSPAFEPTETVPAGSLH